MVRSTKKGARPEKKRPTTLVFFRRYRIDSRTGKKMDAHDYGYKAWPIRGKR